MKTILVAGAGGFIGGHLVGELLKRGGCRVRAVSSRPVDQWIQQHDTVNEQLDLRDQKQTQYAVEGCDEVYNLAAKVGGIDHIKKHKLDCLRSSLINTNLLEASVLAKVKMYFFASSACLYPTNTFPLSEDDAFPFRGEPGYGLEKFFSERMCMAYQEEHGINVRIGRLFNCYGPGDTIKLKENRGHAPAALFVKALNAIQSGRDEIEIWGDGTQLRSFLYVQDAVEAMIRMMSFTGSGFPINVGSSEAVTINELVSIIENYFGIKLQRKYQPDETVGVHSRISDNSLIKRFLDWEPPTLFRQGMKLLGDDLCARVGLV